MIIDQPMLDSLRQWAKHLAPIGSTDIGPFSTGRRRVRLEITTPKNKIVTVQDHHRHVFEPNEIIARVYLAEPRCCPSSRPSCHCDCECDPLAETRIG